MGVGPAVQPGRHVPSLQRRPTRPTSKGAFSLVVGVIDFKGSKLAAIGASGKK